MQSRNKLPLRIGVGIILLNDKNKVFVGKRIDNPKNSWQMPQGGVDENEDFLQAAKRELEILSYNLVWEKLPFLQVWVFFANFSIYEI